MMSLLLSNRSGAIVSLFAAAVTKSGIIFKIDGIVQCLRGRNPVYCVDVL